MSADDNRVVFFSNLSNLCNRPLPRIFHKSDEQALNFYLARFGLLGVSNLFKIRDKIIIHAKSHEEVDLLTKVVIGYEHSIPVDQLEEFINECGGLGYRQTAFMQNLVHQN